MYPISKSQQKVAVPSIHNLTVLGEIGGATSVNPHEKPYLVISKISPEFITIKSNLYRMSYKSPCLMVHFSFFHVWITIKSASESHYFQLAPTVAHYMTSMSQYIPTISHLPTIVGLDTLSTKVILIINPSSWSYSWKKKWVYSPSIQFPIQFYNFLLLL